MLFPMPDRSNNNPATLTSLLKDKYSLLGRLCQHAEYLAHLDKKLCLFLGSPLNSHYSVANYVNDTLVLHSDSAAWAAKLRYNIPAILSYMQNECNLIALKTIRIKIKLPDNSAQHEPVKRKPAISSASALFINQAAALMPDDDLRLSLLKLVKNNQDYI
jgi:hypothetical protein